MRKQTTNWIIWIASFIPGLGLILLGKRRLGLQITFAICLLLAVFLFSPNLFTWYIFGIAFVAQMVYAVFLSISMSINDVDKTRNPNFAQDLPDRFSDKKKIIAEVSKSLSTILGSDEQLLAAVIGQEQNSSQYMYAGVTQEHFILSVCSPAGNPIDPKYISKESVSWMGLKIGTPMMFLSIEIENEQKLILNVPVKLRDPAKILLSEFPGTWSYITSEDDLSKLNRAYNQPGSIITSICIVVFGFLGIVFASLLEKPYRDIAQNLIFSLALFGLGWLPFVTNIKQYIKKPGLTTTNLIILFKVIYILLLWTFSLYITGDVSIGLVKTIQRVI